MAIGAQAVKIGEREISLRAGEVGGNNRGPFVTKYLAPAGLTPPQPWCASFVSWCFQQAAKQLGLPMPFAYCPGARRLFNSLVAEGWKVTGDPEPGDLIFWSRGALSSGLGHVGIVEYAHDGMIQTIEGNHTADVARFKYHWQGMLRLLGFCRVPG